MYDMSHGPNSPKSADNDVDSLDEPALVTNIKANIVRYDDVKATSKYETLSEIIEYFQRMYLANPNSLKIALQPIYGLNLPFSEILKF